MSLGARSICQTVKSDIVVGVYFPVMIQVILMSFTCESKITVKSDILERVYIPVMIQVILMRFPLLRVDG